MDFFSSKALRCSSRQKIDEIFFSAQKMTDFFPNKAGKGPAVQFLQKKWDLKPSECIALFDDDNDIKMVEHCDAGFLPGIFFLGHSLPGIFCSGSFFAL
jgi:hydroxymethylpyrimidine pyrophosphatase-like HAD family hydrolase